MFKNTFKDKKVLVTGNTGFKGGWLTVWLEMLDAKVYGLSVDIPTKPSFYEALNLESRYPQYWGDIRDLPFLIDLLEEVRPDYIFHLAAQAIVFRSYSEPIDTISTNVIGTANILEALRTYNRNCAAVIITSDKCYDNVEWEWGYRETDRLGGKDIYSGSKGAAELICNSYYHSFFKESPKISMATARAGNVIGGGDWAPNRIVVDCMNAWSAGHAPIIRNPHATRPWQHVLEPLSGYLTLAQHLTSGKKSAGESYNFGPEEKQNYTVLQLIKDLSASWRLSGKVPSYNISEKDSFHEAGLLKLNCDKARAHLSWYPTLEYQELIKFTSDWYQTYYNDRRDIFTYTLKQLESYHALAKGKDRIWTR